MTLAFVTISDIRKAVFGARSSADIRESLGEPDEAFRERQGENWDEVFIYRLPSSATRDGKQLRLEFDDGARCAAYLTGAGQPRSIFIARDLPLSRDFFAPFRHRISRGLGLHGRASDPRVAEIVEGRGA